MLNDDPIILKVIIRAITVMACVIKLLSLHVTFYAVLQLQSLTSVGRTLT